MTNQFKAIAAREQMVRAELMGAHSHPTLNGKKVHVWKRDGKFIARGRVRGKAFGETLGNSIVEASARLRQVLSDIDNGAYVLPCERTKRQLADGVVPRLTLRQLADEFLTEKRRLRGLQTARNYKSRLGPVLAFAEQTANRQRWPLAGDIDREFIVKLQPFLVQYRTTRNGQANGASRALSGRQILNILQCLRTLFAWASSPSVRKIPADWRSPLTTDLVGSRPAKDPLRDDNLPLDLRIKLVHTMDRWQLTHLALFTVLPMRPDEAAGLLISDVNFERGWLEFGSQLSDFNFTKEGTAFKLPFPEEFRPLLEACIGGRSEGPLLRSRQAFQKAGGAVASLDALKQQYENQLQQQKDRVQAAHDRKELFRSLLRDLGGVCEDTMNREFKKLLDPIGVKNGATLYSLRSSVTTAMKNANLPHLEMRYLTSHSTNDILNEYSTLDPVAAMQRYFDSIRPLLSAITDRAVELGLVTGVSVAETGLPRLPEITF